MIHTFQVMHEDPLCVDATFMHYVNCMYLFVLYLWYCTCFVHSSLHRLLDGTYSEECMELSFRSLITGSRKTIAESSEDHQVSNILDLIQY